MKLLANERAANKKRKRIKRFFIQNFHRFSKETKLPAMQFIGDDNLSFWPRLFFLIAFVITGVLSFNFGAEVFNKWNNTPIIIGLKSSTTAVDSIPFPAVTICNMNQALYSKVFNYSAATLEYAYLHRTCFEDLNYTAYSIYKTTRKDDTFANFVIKHSQSCASMIVSCKFGNVRRDCTELFREILLDEGLCCVFNTLHPFYLYKGSYNIINSFTTSGSIPVDWSPEKGFAKDLPPKFYPRLAVGAGVSLGLSIVLNAEIHDYFCSSTNGAGFKVAIHNPIDTPHIKDTGIPLGLGRQSRLRLDISNTEAMPTTRSIRPLSRKCFFNDERPLFYYKYYTRRNCEAECDSQFMLRMCNCIPYYMPFIYENASICHIDDFDCVTKAEKDYEDDIKQDCKDDCLPSCFELTIFPTMYSSPIAKNDYGIQERFFENLSREYIQENFALAHFYFNYNSFRSNVRTTYTGLTDFLSQTGGIMSLMMGFSVVSIAEFFYYAVLCPFTEYCRKRNRISSTESIRTNFTNDTVDKSNKSDKFTHGHNIYFIKTNSTQFKPGLVKIQPRAIRRRYMPKQF